MVASNPSRFWKGIFTFGVISVVTGLVISLQAPDPTKATKERETMERTGGNSTPNAAIPPIDRSAPVKTETATFALG